MSNGLAAPAVWSLFIVHRLLSAMRQMGFSRVQQRTAQGHVCAFLPDLYALEESRSATKKKNETSNREIILTPSGTRRGFNTPHSSAQSAFVKISEPITK